MTTVIVADDHALIRAGIRAVLESRADLEIVAEAADGGTAIALTKSHKPALLVLDLNMPNANGIEVLEEARRYSPETRVIILTAVMSTALLDQAISLGAAAVLLKADDGDELLETIPKVLQGEFIVSEQLQSLVGEGGRHRKLTNREMQVLQGLVRGESNAIIAGRLNISPATVNNHRAKIMSKLDVHSVAELLQLALREGYIDTSV